MKLKVPKKNLRQNQNLVKIIKIWTELFLRYAATLRAHCKI